MHLFIDTNIYLAFYHFSSDDLEELQKLLVLLDNKSLTLYVTEQVVDEYERNRENKIADALGRFRDLKLNHQYPQLCQAYPEYPQLRELQKQFENCHASLLAKLQTDIGDQSLKADQLLKSLFKKATLVKRSDTIVDTARRRVELGNPPGKAVSLGDSINWESLLACVPEAQDIYVIADDGDWASALDRYQFKDFLLKEWAVRKKACVFYYRRLATFFKDQFPEIKLAAELEKELAIQKLAKSGSFSTTHAAVAKLSQMAEFTPVQANEIISAALSNNQVGWIARDEDVKAFLSVVLEKHANNLDPADLQAVKKLIEPPEFASSDDTDETDLPF
jgi:predicted nucleic acid-binding protein